MDDCDLFWMLSVLDCQLYFDISKKQRVCIPLFYRGLSVANRVFGLFCAVSDHACTTRGGGQWTFCAAIRFLYKVDAPTNLFPSIHCLVSWFCFIGIAKDNTIPHWYRLVSFFFAIAVFVSTLTTRQHVILDVAGGVVLAQICYWISQKTSFWKVFEKTFDHLNGFFAE